MKRFIILLLPILFSMDVVAQGNKPAKEKGKSAKVKNKADEKEKKEKQNELGKENRSHDDIIWEGTSQPGGKGPKFSKNQPAKVGLHFNGIILVPSMLDGVNTGETGRLLLETVFSLQQLSTMLTVTEEIQGLLSCEEICPSKLKIFLRRGLQHSSVIL
ncbi:MAG: hypothetical protein IPN39_15485 [Chitinophagaceae bacterium]|nr:hypothetical protein [Chitinophagaceae bacterium]